MRGRFPAVGWLTALLALGLLLPAAGATAQEETGVTTNPISREELLQQIREQFQIEEPQQQGGQVIIGSDLATSRRSTVS